MYNSTLCKLQSFFFYCPPFLTSSGQWICHILSDDVDRKGRLDTHVDIECDVQYFKESGAG